MKPLLSIIIAALAAARIALGCDPIVNPGFEQDAAGSQTVTGWQQSGPGTVILGFSPHEGANVYDTSTGGVNGAVSTLSQVAIVRESGTYTIRAWARVFGGNAGTGKGTLSISNYNGSDISIPFPPAPASPYEWAMAEIKDIQLTALSSIKVGLLFSGTGSAQFDDVTFTRQGPIAVSPPQNLHVAQ